MFLKNNLILELLMTLNYWKKMRQVDQVAEMHTKSKYVDLKKYTD
jgi:hypothetical protein